MKVYNALALAAQLHGNQKYGKEPYMVHVAQVAEVLRYYLEEYPGDSTDLLCAGVLHDVLEDCDVTVGVLEQLFGKRVATIVELVSNPDHMITYSTTDGKEHTVYLMAREDWTSPEDFDNLVFMKNKLSRPEKHKIQYPKISQNADARLVKLADRLANVMSGDFRDMYRGEHQMFKSILQDHETESQETRNRSGMEARMWWDLDELLK
jgi:(p)ppGpp synthase/HD superfamily hydrolase